MPVFNNIIQYTWRWRSRSISFTYTYITCTHRKQNVYMKSMCVARLPYSLLNRKCDYHHQQPAVLVFIPRYQQHQTPADCVLPPLASCLLPLSSYFLPLTSNLLPLTAYRFHINSLSLRSPASLLLRPRLRLYCGDSRFLYGA